MDERAVLEHYRLWLRKIAFRMCSRQPDRVEDLAQEGWIAMWQAMKTWDGVSSPFDYWIERSAIDRMRVMIRHWTAACRDMHNTEFAGHPASAGAEDSVWAGLRTDLGDIEWAYHHGEIMDAINQLTPRQREYIVLRYWYGWGTKEMTAHFGYPPKTVGQQARKNLGQLLVHLVDA